MLVRGEQLPGLLEKGIKPLYVVYGDSPLLVLEAADTLRRFSRQQGYIEREVLTVLPGFDWGQLSAAAGNMSLFGDRKLIDLRIPNSKPGKEGAAALADYCQRMGPDNVLLITLGPLDWKEEKSAWLASLTQAGIVVKLTAPSLGELPGWLAGRLRSQGQEADEETLRFMAERVEGNLLAAHQELQKLGLLYPEGRLSMAQVRDAVLNVARYSVEDVREALLAGDLARLHRTLEGLRQEGEAPLLVLWAMTEEIRTLAQAKAGLARGQGLEGLFRELRVWGNRQTLMRRSLPGLAAKKLKEALELAASLDRTIKGLENGNTWDGFLRLGMLLQYRRGI